MNSEHEPPKRNEPRQSHDSGTNGTPEANRQNDANTAKSDFWPFDEARPRKLTPEEIESLLQLWDEDDERQAAADLRDILENGGGISSDEFLRAIEQAARENA